MVMDELRVRPLRKDEESEFEELVIHYIGLWYDDIEESFTQIILEAHKRGYDPLGYFTKNKTIWVAYLKGEMCGFLVGTEKRGRSVKLAPGIVKPEYQRRGIGTKLWKEVEEIYRKKGLRKIYNHAPLYRFDLLKWVTSLGLRLEAHLKEHYRKGQDEYVAGKFINPRKGSPSIKPILWSNHNVQYSIRDYEEEDQKSLEMLILKEMPRFYDEIDKAFVNSIVDAEKRFKETFKRKGKKIFVVTELSKVIGCCVATPKRGGAVKLAPFLFYPEKANYRMAMDLLEHVEEFFKKLGYRKLYAPIPVYDIESCYVFKKQGFEIEGILREPYKPGVDNYFFGKIIGG